MLEFKSGDMFLSHHDVLVNTVNCVGVMGKGIAKEFKRKFPDMFEEYSELCSKGEIKPGKLHVWEGIGFTIINFPTKRHWKDGSRYEDIEAGLVALRDYLQDKTVSVALPALGCSNGGLEWGIVSKMITRYLSGVKARVSAFQPIGR